MRDTATLSRPSYRSASAESDTPSRGLIAGRATVVLAVLFLIGVVLGWGVTRLLPGAASQQISTAEYTALVAQLYQRDQNVGIARERLALFGSPEDLALQAAQTSQAGKLAVPSDSSTVDALVVALTGTRAATSPANDSATTAATDPVASGQARSDHTSWLGPVLAFVVAFGLGIVVLLRTARLSPSFLRLPSFRRSSTLERPNRTGRRSGLPGRFDSDAPRHQALSISEASLRDDDDDDDREDVDRLSVPRAVTPIRSAVRPNRKASGVLYQSTYRLGDDPFDEIHPIADPVSGGLIAACGLSSALKFDSLKIGGYYAFSAWIQDYGNAEELHAAGLVAPGAPEAARSQIEGWVRSAQLDTVLSLEVGASALIGSTDLAATITVVDVEFGLSGDEEDSYVTELVLKFEVQRRVEPPIPAKELARARQ